MGKLLVSAKQAAQFHQPASIHTFWLSPPLMKLQPRNLWFCTIFCLLGVNFCYCSCASFNIPLAAYKWFKNKCKKIGAKCHKINKHIGNISSRNGWSKIEQQHRKTKRSGKRPICVSLFLKALCRINVL